MKVFCPEKKKFLVQRNLQQFCDSILELMALGEDGF